MEFSKRFKIEEVWPAELIAKKPEYKGKTLYDVLFANGVVNKFPLAEVATVNGHAVDELHERRVARPSASTCRRACSRNTRSSAAATAHDLAPFDTYHKARGLRWPVVDGKETLWRFREGYDPYVKAGEGVKFYGHKDGRAVIFALPYEPAAGGARTRNTTCGCAPAACSSTGTPAR